MTGRNSIDPERLQSRTSGDRSSNRLWAVLVLVGSFAAPVAQWVVFFLVARVGGTTDAGAFALLFAVATPVVIATNWGLRNGYITLPRHLRFADFVLLRSAGVALASGILTGFGIWAGLDVGLVAAVIAMKAADSMVDMWYGRWQQQQRLRPFSGLMILNGAATIIGAGAFALLGLPSAWIVFGSTLGSIVTFGAALVVDRSDIAAWLKGDRVTTSGRRELRLIMADCWPIAGGQILAVLVVNIPTWGVAAFGNTGDIGRFAAAAYLITFGSLLGSSLNSVVLGSYRADVAAGRTSAVQRRVRRGTAAVTYAGLAVVLIVWLVGESVFSLLFGGQFVYAPLELGIVALAAALNPGTFLMNAALLAANSYGAQMAIVAAAVAGSGVAVGVAAGLQLSGFMVGALCALAGSLVKFALSAVWTRRVLGLIQTAAS